MTKQTDKPAIHIHSGKDYDEFIKSGRFCKKSVPKNTFSRKRNLSLKAYFDFFKDYNAGNSHKINLKNIDFIVLGATFSRNKIFAGNKDFILLFKNILAVYWKIGKLYKDGNILCIDKLVQAENVKLAFVLMRDAEYCTLLSINNLLIPSLTIKGINLLAYITNSTYENAKKFSDALDSILTTIIKRYLYQRICKYLEDNEYDVSDDKELFGKEHVIVAKKQFGRYYIRILSNDFAKKVWGSNEYKKIDEFYSQSHNLIFIVLTDEIKSVVIKNIEKYIISRYRIVNTVSMKKNQYQQITPKEMFLDEGNIYSVCTINDILKTNDFPRVLPMGSNLIMQISRRKRGY